MHVKIFSSLAFLVSTKSKVHNIKCNYCYVNNIDLKYSLLEQKSWILECWLTVWYSILTGSLIATGPEILIELKNMF